MVEWWLALLSLSKKVLEMIARPGSFAGWACMCSLCLHGLSLACRLPPTVQSIQRWAGNFKSSTWCCVCVSVWQPCDGLSWMPVSIFIQNTWIRYVYSNFAMLATPIILLQYGLVTRVIVWPSKETHVKKMGNSEWSQRHNKEAQSFLTHYYIIFLELS